MPHTWSVGPGASSAGSAPTRALTTARDRQLVTRVDGHPYAQCTIDDRHPQAAEIIDLVSDLWVRDENDTLLFRGRVIPSDHDVNPNTHRRQIHAIGYRGMLTLAAAVDQPPPTFTAVDDAQIAWQLVQHRQAQTGGSWGITEGVGAAAGQLSDLTTLVAGKPIGEAIDQLLRRENGGEWDINPNLQLDRWWPRRGASNGVVLDYGGIISSFRLAGAHFGNHAIATGSSLTTPATATTATIATDPRGRWSIAEAFTSIETQTELQAKANWIRDEASTIERRWTVRFAPGRWEGPAHVGLGDIVKFQARSGSLNVNSPHRVVQLELHPGENGTLNVLAGLVEEPA